jgi:hypothetical protein
LLFKTINHVISWIGTFFKKKKWNFLFFY